MTENLPGALFIMFDKNGKALKSLSRMTVKEVNLDIAKGI